MWTLRRIRPKSKHVPAATVSPPLPLFQLKVICCLSGHGPVRCSLEHLHALLVLHNSIIVHHRHHRVCCDPAVVPLARDFGIACKRQGQTNVSMLHLASMQAEVSREATLEAGIPQAGYAVHLPVQETAMEMDALLTCTD